MSKPPPLIRPARKLPSKQKNIHRTSGNIYIDRPTTVKHFIPKPEKEPEKKKPPKKKRQRRFSDILKDIQEEGRIAGINNRALQKKITLVF